MTSGPLVLPSRDDPVAAGASQLIGGPPGRRARLGSSGFWTPIRWILLLTIVVSTLGWGQKSPCRVHPWSEDYQYTRACYTDVYALYGAEQLHDKTPYLDYPVEYPAIIGGVMGVVAPISDAIANATTDGDAGLARYYRFYDLTWVVLTGFALVVAVTTAKLAGRRPWDAAMFAVAPSLLLHGTTNWDLIAVAFAGLGMLAWARKMPVAAGVMLGLGAATKLYPAFFVLPLLALCWRSGHLRAGLRTTVAMVLTGAAVVLPVYLVSPSFAEIGGVQTKIADSPLSRLGDDGLAALAPHTSVELADGTCVTGVNSIYRFVELNRTRPADWDSLAFGVGQLRAQSDAVRNVRADGSTYYSGGNLLTRFTSRPVDWLLRSDSGGAHPCTAATSTPSNLNAVTAIGTVAVFLGVVLLALLAPRRPRLPQLLAVAMIGFLLVNKVYSPQYVLWLVPLIVLARPRWRMFLVWQVTEVLVLFARFYYFVSFEPGDASDGIDVMWFVSAVLVRDLALLVIAFLIVREVLRPSEDLVREDGVDDPAGGVLDGAEDVRVQRELSRAATP